MSAEVDLVHYKFMWFILKELSIKSLNAKCFAHTENKPVGETCKVSHRLNSSGGVT